MKTQFEQLNNIRHDGLLLKCFQWGMKSSVRVDQAMSHTPGNRKRAQWKQGVKICPQHKVRI